MNCPGILNFPKLCKSERDLPLRLMEFGILHRNEPSNSLKGLFRLCEFTQDDAHIYCTLEQAKSEILDIIESLTQFYQHFSFEYEAELSTRPEKSIGEDDKWESLNKYLKNVLLRLIQIMRQMKVMVLLFQNRHKY